MSSLADLPEVIGFFSYSREDDEAYEGTLSALRDAIQRELSAQLGRSKTNFRLWQDQKAIAPGQLWESEIKMAVEQAVFFIPIVTPRAVNSRYCKFEFEAFLAREQALGRTDLVFPLLYIRVPALENEAQWREDPVLSIIGKRQYVDWRPLRHLDVRTTTVREQIEHFCDNIVGALREPWASPEERRKQEADAKRRASEEKRRAEAASQAAEETQRAVATRQAEERQRARAARRVEEERQRADAARRGEEERQRADAARRGEEDQRAEVARQEDEDEQRAEAVRREAEEALRAWAERQAEEEKQRAEAARQAKAEKRQRQTLLGRHPIAAISTVVGSLLILVVVLTKAGVFRTSTTREASTPPVTTTQSAGPNQPPASTDLSIPTQTPVSKYPNTLQRANRSCSDIKTRFKTPMKFDEYVDAIKWLNGGEPTLDFLPPEYSINQSMKTACDNLLKGVKGANTYTTTLNNVSVSAEARLERGKCVIFITSVSC